MSLHDELLETARYLLRRDRGRPSQADLRRCVSTAYYSLFHALIGDGADRLSPDPVGRVTVARRFDHGPMKAVCELVEKSNLPDVLKPYLGPAIPAELRDLAAAFSYLQKERHAADYDRGRAFSKAEARSLVAQAEAAHHAWGAVKGMPVADSFLLLLLIGIKNRG